ncbi:MAG: hypothetical protein MJ052_03135 [Sphaerochaetaceae bacterium]|nr:hypothetical protein [Sphaerochaetaceae bacterium]
MVQFFFLAEIYLLTGSAVLLADTYGASVLFLIGIRSFVLGNRKTLIAFMVAGLVIASGLVLVPMEPGPLVLGDLIPSLTIILLVLFYLKKLGEPERNLQTVYKQHDTQGFITLSIAILHFTLPGIVLI